MRYLTLFLALSALPAWAGAPLPSGGNVVRGDANIQSSGNTMTITQTTPRAVISWNDFSVGASNTVQFIQPSASAAVLNRVTGSNPSRIDGLVSANGTVYILNPNGISVGATGRIDAAGVVLSTANVSDDDFMAGTVVFDPAPQGPEIRVEGTVAASNSIEIHADVVTNLGTLDAPSLTVSDHNGPLFQGTSIWDGSGSSSGVSITLNPMPVIDGGTSPISDCNCSAIPTNVSIPVPGSLTITTPPGGLPAIRALGVTPPAGGTLTLTAVRTGGGNLSNFSTTAGRNLNFASPEMIAVIPGPVSIAQPLPHAAVVPGAAMAGTVPVTDGVVTVRMRLADVTAAGL